MDSLDPRRLGTDLMVIELDLVGTFLRLARTSPNAETRKRNQTYAREAYQVACRYRSRLILPPELNRVIRAKFSEAEAELGIAASVSDY